ncbi:atp-dependent rna helicase dhx35 isoform x1 [Nannochloropsis oceanica]
MTFWKPGAAAPRLREERPVGLSEAGASSTLGYNPRSKLPLKQQRLQLPIAQARSGILYALERYRTLVLVGETGSGKSTQVPQYLHEGGWTHGGRVVLCTQPRRVAAVTVASRVAQEMGCILGQQVGYVVRFDSRVDEAGTRTAIKFVTDGLLLRETLYDPLLSAYSVIMLDEAHERSMYTDVLLGLLKKVRKRRPELRIIISSATADAEAFRDYFETHTHSGGSISNKADNQAIGTHDATIISIMGRQHAVDVLYMEKPARNYLRAAVEAVLSIVQGEGRGDILVFLPGMEEIDQAVTNTKEQLGGLGYGVEDAVLVLPLYASLPQHLQMKALGPAPRHVERKVLFATNIAETSLTIEGVRFIVDTGFVKLPVYDVRTGFESLVTTPISKASAAQRAGRAGRTGPGKCMRLYTEEAFIKLPAHTLPEVQRSNLAWMILQLKALGIDEVMSFDFISQPSAEAMMRGLELLYALGALDDRCHLSSELGEKMAEFPVEPRLAKVLLASFDFHCTEEALTVVALLQVQNLWTSPKGRESRALQEESMSDLAQREGDHLTLLHIYRAWEEAGRSMEWCTERFINPRSLARAREIRGQLRKYLERYKPAGSVFASCCEDTEALRRCIVAGFFFNAARLQSDGRYYTVRGEHPVALHPASVLAKYGTPAEWVVFHDVVLTTEPFLRDCSRIQPLWLMELAPHFYAYGGGGRNVWPNLV